VFQYISLSLFVLECMLTKQITRTPSAALGTAHRIRHVHEHEVAYVEAHGPFDLLIVQELPKDTFIPGAQLSFDYRDCVQPASLQRIPRRCLHQLPGNIILKMVESSLEAVLRRVDGIACAMGDPTKSCMLPEGLQDGRRREDIITLNLLRTIDRMKQPVIVAQPPSSINFRKTRKTSIWEQGRVPRNGGRG
jgi:hypothetical protein